MPQRSSQERVAADEREGNELMVTVSIDHELPGGAPAARMEVQVAARTGPAGVALEDLVVGQTRQLQLDAAGHATVDLDPVDVADEPIIWQIRVGNVTRHLDLSAASGTVSWADPSVLVLEGPAPSDWVPVQGPQGEPGVVAASGLAAYDPETQTVDVPAEPLLTLLAAGVAEAGLPGSVGLRPTGLEDWWPVYAGRGTAPVNIAVIGDSKTEQDSAFSEGRAWPYLLERVLNGGLPDLDEQSGYRASITGNALVPGFTTNAGAVNTTSTAGRGSTLTAGQTATLTATMDGISIVYTTSPGAGSIEVRDGVGGTLLGTIDTDAAAKSGHVWTSGALASASHTIELTSVGTTVVDGCYIHQGSRTAGVRVWKLARSGATNAQFVSTPAWGLDFIENNAADLDLVILAGGTNDGASWDAATRDLLDAVLATGYTGPVALLIPEFNANLPIANDHQTLGHAIAAEYGLAVIDMAQAMLRGHLESSPYAGFGVHQNGEGQWLYARTAAAVLSGDPFGTDNRLDRIRTETWQNGADKTVITAGSITNTVAGATALINHAGLVLNSDTALVRLAAGELLVGSALGALSGTADGLVAAKYARFTEAASDAAAQAADRAVLYTKNAGGRSRLYTRDDVGVRSVAYTDDEPTPNARESGGWYSQLGLVTASTALGMTAAGVLMAIPAWLDAGAYDRLGVATSVAAVSTWRLGVYPSDPTTGRPDGQTLLIDAGTVNMNATAGILTTGAIALAIATPGVYWLVALVDAYTATPTVYGWASTTGTAQPPLRGVPLSFTSGATAARHRCGRTASGVATGAIPATCPALGWTDLAPRIAARGT
jgi:hypothetical protein